MTPVFDAATVTTLVPLLVVLDGVAYATLTPTTCSRLVKG